ncbi:class I SAM-dependent DNA methyltransferase [Vibrio maerlii]|uniref:class I SAM-dependent DNA methyltransferase n=1 Tax=Vibrio maerlii TaxID=2231648 RepID=UPI000E3CC067|nr:class I SAM-dependent methyltransferase [Vibrio maerlii]
MSNEWDQYAEEWEQDEATHTFARSAFEQLTQITSIDGKHILDFGCGTGLLSQLLNDQAKSIVALDASESMIEELDKKALNNVEPVVDVLSRGLAAQHPAFRKQFDLVIASSVCSFLPNYQDVMDIVFSILENGGYFVQWDWLSEEGSDSAYGMTKQRISSSLYSVGFNEVTVSEAFEIETKSGSRKVVMGVAYKD